MNLYIVVHCFSTTIALNTDLNIPINNERFFSSIINYLQLFNYMTISNSTSCRYKWFDFKGMLNKARFTPHLLVMQVSYYPNKYGWSHGITDAIIKLLYSVVILQCEENNNNWGRKAQRAVFLQTKDPVSVKPYSVDEFFDVEMAKHQQ